MIFLYELTPLCSDAQKENLLVKGQLEVKQFCIDYVQRAEVLRFRCNVMFREQSNVQM